MVKLQTFLNHIELNFAVSETGSILSQLTAETGTGRMLWMGDV